jgi:hypothetical protein
MSQADRNCILPDENQSISLLNKYSKSACEYECAISFSMNQCGCIPWNMPRNQAAETLPLCELKADNCYEQMLRNFSTLDCGCKSGMSTNLIYIYCYTNLCRKLEFCIVNNIKFWLVVHWFGKFKIRQKISEKQD